MKPLPTMTNSAARGASSKRSFLACACASAALLAAGILAGTTAPASAQYPERTISLVVPFAAGGGTDLIARTLAQAMGADLGQPVIVENRPGAGTIVGTRLVAGSAPDGYTLVMASFAHAVNPSLYEKLPYDHRNGFAPVALVARSFNVVVVNPKLPVQTLKDLLAYAKANPVRYGSFGNGTSAHLAAELLKIEAKVDLSHVPYRGSAPAITDLLGGHIQVMVSTAASVAPYLANGSLRGLAVTSPERSPAFPDLPTVAEAGVPGYVAESWYGIFAPAGTPPDVVARLNASIAKATQTDAFKKLQQVEGLVIVAGPPQDLQRYVDGEEARWAKVIRDARIKPE